MTHLSPGQHIHLVGIGGAGLSAIARVLLGQGYRVSGSDRTLNPMTEALAHDGARIYAGHAAENVAGADVVIISSAVQPDHVEVQTARELGIPVYKRSDIIADLMQHQDCIAVAGTHGKTTTTAMIVHILRETGHNPSYIIGGTLRTTGQNAGVGTGRAFVIEADEYDNMFHGLRPKVAVVTNVEWDHPDFFPTPDTMTASFCKFVGLIQAGGLLVTCADDPGAARLNACLPDHATSAAYSITNASFHASNCLFLPDRTAFMMHKQAQIAGNVTLKVPGQHNILNAMAALMAADFMDVPLHEAANALATFEGTGRRFDLRGEVNGIAVIDDYAHHPTAIRVNLEAARARYPEREVWAVWQPHTYSRTQTFMDDYLNAFGAADHVLVTDIYAAREAPVPGVTSETLVNRFSHPDARHTPSLDDAAELLDARVSGPAAIIIFSAGDAPKIGIEFLRRRTGAP